jgi:hypothetical protein
MQRKILAAAAALLMLCTAAATAPTAQAVDSTGFSPMSDVLWPTTSPAVSNGYIEPGRTVGCGSGHACVAVPYGEGLWGFDFYNYGSYSTYKWTGTGTIMNVQTGNAAIRYDDARGRQLGCIPADGRNHSVYLNPVYRIRLTATPC